MKIETSGERFRMTFGVKEWIAIVSVSISIAWFCWDTRDAVSENRQDIDRIAGAMEKITNSLDQLIRLDERVKAVEARIDRLPTPP